jgi:sterol desaturase/sphingolipid hydroxylase (fatty acid hydroxylase superfamily)
MPGTVDMLLAYKSLAVGAWFASLFVAERLHPAVRPAAGTTGDAAGGRRRLGRNLGLWLGNVGLSPLVVVPVSAWAAGHHLGLRPAWWDGAAGLALDLVLLDFLIYWWHRVNHRLPVLWRFHEVHHLDRFLDTTTAVRFHCGEVLISAAARAVVIMAFGIPLGSVLAFEALVLAAAVFHHSNLRLPPGLERRLARLIITPSIHWVHHHAVRRDTDSNYGTIFSFWDPLFGTRSPTPRSPTMAIGIERTAEQPLLRLIVRPFLPRG